MGKIVAGDLVLPKSFLRGPVVAVATVVPMCGTRCGTRCPVEAYRRLVPGQAHVMAPEALGSAGASYGTGTVTVTAPYGTVRHRTVPYGPVRSRAVPYGPKGMCVYRTKGGLRRLQGGGASESRANSAKARTDTAPYGTVRHRTAPYGTVWHRTARSMAHGSVPRRIVFGLSWEGVNHMRHHGSTYRSYC